jgi:coenzyme PQQ precursor peptide PqqA
MRWTKPEFQEITLNMEVTAYVNTAQESLVISHSSIVKEDMTEEVTNDQ